MNRHYKVPKLKVPVLKYKDTFLLCKVCNYILQKKKQIVSREMKAWENEKHIKLLNKAGLSACGFKIFNSNSYQTKY